MLPANPALAALTTRMNQVLDDLAMVDVASRTPEHFSNEEVRSRVALVVIGARKLLSALSTAHAENAAESARLEWALEHGAAACDYDSVDGPTVVQLAWGDDLLYNLPGTHYDGTPAGRSAALRQAIDTLLSSAPAPEPPDPKGGTA